MDRGVANDVTGPTRAGTYLLVCFLPDERKRRGRAHVELGMGNVVRIR
jgi:hypothetical protein